MSERGHFLTLLSKQVAIFLFTIISAVVITVLVGSELITQFSMYINGYGELERHLLEDDYGFGILLIIGLFLEVMLGVLFGVWLGYKLKLRVAPKEP